MENNETGAAGSSARFLCFDTLDDGLDLVCGQTGGGVEGEAVRSITPHCQEHQTVLSLAGDGIGSGGDGFLPAVRGEIPAGAD